MRSGAALLLLVACRVELGAPAGPIAHDPAAAAQGEVWVYTSMYQSVLDVLEPKIEAALPGVDVRFYQAGSEKVAQRAEAEWAAGGTKACLLMTSDPFWYADLNARGHLAPHLAPNVLHLDRSLVDRDGMWATARLSLVVLATTTDLPASERPASFAALAEPRFADRITMGDPLASGTMLSALAFWIEDGGWERVEALRGNGLIASGGNSSVLTRLETREREVGVLLLENLLVAQRKGSPTVTVFPTDGAITVPGPIALTTDCRNPTAARAVYDFVLSPEGQAVIVGGDMYGVLPDTPPPKGAPPLADIPIRAWPDGFVEEVAATRGAIKERYTRLMSGR